MAYKYKINPVTGKMDLVNEVGKGEFISNITSTDKTLKVVTDGENVDITAPAVKMLEGYRCGVGTGGGTFPAKFCDLYWSHSNRCISHLPYFHCEYHYFENKAAGGNESIIYTADLCLIFGNTINREVCNAIILNECAYSDTEVSADLINKYKISNLIKVDFIAHATAEGQYYGDPRTDPDSGLGHAVVFVTGLDSRGGNIHLHPVSSLSIMENNSNYCFFYLNPEVVTGKCTSYTTQGTIQGTKLADKDEIQQPIVYKGTLGTNGDITSLPTASEGNHGWQYKVITAGIYNGYSANVGDSFVSNGSSWGYYKIGELVGTTTADVLDIDANKSLQTTLSAINDQLNSVHGHTILINLKQYQYVPSPFKAGENIVDIKGFNDSYIQFCSAPTSGNVITTIYPDSYTSRLPLVVTENITHIRIGVTQTIEFVIQGEIDALKEKDKEIDAIKNDVYLSSSPLINDLVKEVYLANPSVDFVNSGRIEINVAALRNNKYRNMIRVGATEGQSSYMEVLFEEFATQDAALFSIRNKVGVIRKEVNKSIVYAYVDFSRVSDSMTVYGICNKDITNIWNAPYIDLYMRNIGFGTTIQTEDYDEIAKEPTDGINKVFTFSNPIKQVSSIYVYVDGLKKTLNREYTIDYLHRVIRFVSAPKSGAIVSYHYTTNWQIEEEYMRLNDCGLADGRSLKGNLAKYGIAISTNDFGYLTAQYAEMVADPTDSSNQVVAFVSRSCTNKSRVQKELGGLHCSEYESSIDMYLPSDSLSCLEDYPGAITWLTIQETWVPFGDDLASTTTKNPGCRATLGILKDANSSLYLALEVQDRFKNSDATERYVRTAILRDNIQQKFAIPFDKWITLKTSAKTGSANNGHYKLSVVVDGIETSIFDTDIVMMNTAFLEREYPQAEELFINPNTCLMKMYTSNTLLNYIVENSESHEMRILWKNWSFKSKSIKR